MGSIYTFDSCIRRTIEYYKLNAQKYAEQTKQVDMGQVYQAFMPFIPKGGRILDVGCGAGRDLKWFCDHGYQAEGLEPVPALAEISRTLSGAPVQELRVEELDAQAQYDGIWACASLLHIPRRFLKTVIERLIYALKPKGILYMCFKKGLTDRVAEDGRLFDDQTCESLAENLRGVASAVIVSCWESTDKLGGRKALTWTNILVRKEPEYAT